MLNPSTITVNERKYHVGHFTPEEAFTFLHALIHCRMYGRRVDSLGLAAIRQCVSPEGRRLDDEGYFTEWFSKYPADLLALEATAIATLSEPWEGKQTSPEQENNEPAAATSK